MNSKILSKAFLLIIFLFFIYTFFKWPIQDYCLNKFGIITTGKIIDERGYNGKYGNMRKESNGDAIIYCYAFDVDNKTYKGDSQSSSYKIGDTIEVIYIKSYPSINRPNYYLKKK